MDVSEVVAASQQLSLVAEIQLEEYAGKCDVDQKAVESIIILT